ncbi:hypothetical protein [Azospirillum sp.]|uniref:hypothetical protein n=1 Tax=Azospirillum sp. TaxID=34012 RepID=UPI003D745E75
MSEWVIVSGGAVLYGPTAWDRASLEHRLGLAGWSVTLGAEPAVWRSPLPEDFGDDPPVLPELPAALLPCTVVCEAFDPAYRVRGEASFVVGPEAVTATYAVEDRPLAQVQAEAVARINAEAGQKRARYITQAVGQEGTYVQKAAEARAFLAGGAGPFPYLAAEAEHTPDATVASIATLVAATETAWTAINAGIEGRRRGALVAVAAAGNVAAVAALFPIAWEG